MPQAPKLLPILWKPGHNSSRTIIFCGVLNLLGMRVDISYACVCAACAIMRVFVCGRFVVGVHSCAEAFQLSFYCV